MGTYHAHCWERRWDTLPTMGDSGSDSGSSASSTVPGHVFQSYVGQLLKIILNLVLYKEGIFSIYAGNYWG